MDIQLAQVSDFEDKVKMPFEIKVARLPSAVNKLRSMDV